MKKITTMILTGIFCLALFIPSGCKETGNEIDCEATLLQYRLKDNFFEENPVYGVAYTNERYNPEEDNGERPYLYDETSPANRTFIITEKKQAETIFEDTFVDYDKTDFQKEFFIIYLYASYNEYKKQITDTTIDENGVLKITFESVSSSGSEEPILIQNSIIIKIKKIEFESIEVIEKHVNK